MAAPAPTSEIQIVNLALGRIGQGPVTSIETPTSVNEIRMAAHYAPCRQKLLRAYIFNFSKKLATLTAASGVAPAFGYSSAFSMPADSLRLLAVGDVTINDDTPAGYYDFDDGYLCTDQTDNDGNLQIQYVKDVKTVSKWDVLFRDLMRLQLAKDVAYLFTLKPSLITQIDVELENVKLQATAISGQEKPPRRKERSRLLEMRRRNGTGSSRGSNRYEI